MTKKQIERVLSKLGDTVTGPADLFGEKKPSPLFNLMIRLAKNLHSLDPVKMVSQIGIRIRRLVHPVLMLLLPLFMEYKQVFESKNALLGIDAPDTPLKLDGAAIWCPPHCFKDDVAGSIAVNHGWVMFGSFPTFFNSLDGLGAYVNGVVLCNRKVKASKTASMEASKRLLNMGMDLILYPEGVWNKTPDKLILRLWPGVYRVAKETGCKIVPVIHYLADPHKKYEGNVIHTVVADPISMEGLSEKEGLALLRDTMATWYFLLIEKYGQSTREELLNGFETADEAWEDYIAMHTAAVEYYDKEAECFADYRPKQIIRPENVWQSVANIKNVNAWNIAHILYAKELIEQEKRRDFQRRF